MSDPIPKLVTSSTYSMLRLQELGVQDPGSFVEALRTFLKDEVQRLNKRNANISNKLVEKITKEFCSKHGPTYCNHFWDKNGKHGLVERRVKDIIKEYRHVPGELDHEPGASNPKPMGAAGLCSHHHCGFTTVLMAV